MSRTIDVKKDFFRITQILPLRRANYLEDRQIRRDKVFSALAEKVFDHPALADILAKKVKAWLILDESEFICSIAGYSYYFKGNFNRAARYFSKAVEKNPQNLDNWMDLAFALYHTGDYKLALEMLFYFDSFIVAYQTIGPRSCNLSILKQIAKRISRNDQ